MAKTKRTTKDYGDYLRHNPKSVCGERGCCGWEVDADTELPTPPPEVGYEIGTNRWTAVASHPKCDCFIKEKKKKGPRMF